MGNTKTKVKTNRIHLWMEIINIFQTLNTLWQALLLKLADQRPLGNSDMQKQIRVHREPDPPETTWTWKAEQLTILKVNYSREYNLHICLVCLGQAYLFQLCQLLPPLYHFCCHCKLIHSSADFALYFELAGTIFWHFQKTIFCRSTAGPSQPEVYVFHRILERSGLGGASKIT